MNNSSHIVPVMIGDTRKRKRLGNMLLRHYRIYLQPINYPTVAKGEERLRITPNPCHSDEHLAHLVKALSDLWSRCAMARSVA